MKVWNEDQTPRKGQPPPLPGEWSQGLQTTPFTSALTSSRCALSLVCNQRETQNICTAGIYTPTL